MKHATWPLRVIAEAADMEQRALRQLFDTNILKIRGDDQRSTGTGTPVKLSKNRAYESAIIKHGKGVGLPPSLAAQAAYAFTLNGTAERPAGTLFKHGTTALVIGPNGAAVRNVFSNETIADVTDRKICSVYINLTRIVENCDAILDSISKQKA